PAGEDPARATGVRLACAVLPGRVGIAEVVRIAAGAAGPAGADGNERALAPGRVLKLHPPCPMAFADFALPLSDYGLPTREQFQALRIWDLHYHGLFEIAPTDPVGRNHQEMMFYMDRFGIERSLALDIG